MRDASKEIKDKFQVTGYGLRVKKQNTRRLQDARCEVQGASLFGLPVGSGEILRINARKTSCRLQI